MPTEALPLTSVAGVLAFFVTLFLTGQIEASVTVKRRERRYEQEILELKQRLDSALQRVDKTIGIAERMMADMPRRPRR